MAEQGPRHICGICNQPITPGEEIRRFYLPDAPDQVSHGHAHCIDWMQREAASDKDRPIVID